MATTIITRRTIEVISPTRRIVYAVIFLLLAAIMLLVFTLDYDPATITTMSLTPTGVTRGAVADLTLPGFPVLITMNVLVALAGLYQLIRGFGRKTNLMLGFALLLFILAFLVWTAGIKKIYLGSLLLSGITLSVPVILGAFSGVLSERAGVVNIAIEGMMLMGAMTGALIGSLTGSAWWGLLAAMVAAMLMALVHGWLSIKYRVDQIISGTVINIFATGMTSYISSKFMQHYENLNGTPVFQRMPIPGLADIPLIGPIFFNANLFVYIMFALLIILQIALFKTRWGLRMRSVGEHPKAADTLGINVIRTRYMAVLLSGMVAGIGGAFFTVGSIGRFEEMMTAGKGFIGLAAMIFGNWTPIGAFGAGLLFGSFESLGPSLSLLGSKIPSEFIAMLPYIATMVILAGVVGRGQMPAADGTPYVKE
jgi:simple sugar transport system permease protein